MDVYVGVEGFTLPSGFVLKELCLLHPNKEFSYFLFKPPINQQFSEVDFRTIRYTTTKLNNISWCDGHVPMDSLPAILQEIQQYKIYTYSEIARRMLQEILPVSTVVDVQALGHKLPNCLPSANCGRQHRPRYCAKAKAVAIRDFVENSCNQ